MSEKNFKTEKIELDTIGELQKLKNEIDICATKTVNATYNKTESDLFTTYFIIFPKQ